METTLTLPTLPEDSFRALQKSVAGQFNWRILSGGKTEQPRFVIEKQAAYSIVRGLSLSATYRVVGSFQKTKSGETALNYTVSGDAGTAALHAALNISLILVFAILIGMLSTGKGMPANTFWIIIMIEGILLATIVMYSIYAYRSYKSHLRELDTFMRDFANRP